MLALTANYTSSSFVLANAAIAVFYVTVDSYYGCFIATVVDFTSPEVRGLTIGIILTFGYIGSIYQTFAFHSLADVYNNINGISVAFLCLNYLAALVCFMVLSRIRTGQKQISAQV